MKIFDAHIRSDTRSDDDLKNLAYFGTERVVTASHAPRSFEHADQLLSYFHALATSEAERIRRCGLVPYVAIGVLPEARPRRTHYELWDELPGVLASPEVVAVGECGAHEDVDDQWELFERHIGLAKDAKLPLLVSTPSELRVNMTYKMMQRLARHDFPPEMVMFNHLDARLVETVVEEGYVAGISVGPYHLDPREAAPIVASVLDALGSSERIVLNSALRAGGGDILGIPKAAVMLGDAGLSTRDVERVVYGNAMALFVR